MISVISDEFPKVSEPQFTQLKMGIAMSVFSALGKTD